ncbi:MAG TPA: putative toxin-antitoxin system toxin component, PIN family [Terracidiphilus sp.]|nr:putative toxin-antitoxin system toxin component, PIN family [Terracidiphilus sp.]
MFDTNSVVSALVFPAGRLSWLRGHWRGRQCLPLVCRDTVAELSRVLAYPKFQLSSEERIELLGDYLPFGEIVEKIEHCPQTCRDPKDQIFLDLAHTGKADVLVTGDKDLLELDSRTAFSIESPESYRARVIPRVGWSD